VFRIVREPIDHHALERIVESGHGGVVTFLGTVRDDAVGGRRVSALWYEAFEPMAVREVRLAIVHRVGELHVGEISVAVLAAAPHRASAFDACRYAIDQLKARAPIWKQERYESGAPQWKSSVE
jgi:molybdopterin synthase catalytic subunit